MLDPNNRKPNWEERQRAKNRQGLIIIAIVVVGLGAVFTAVYLSGHTLSGVHGSEHQK